MEDAVLSRTKSDLGCAFLLTGIEFRSRVTASKQVLRLAQRRQETRYGYAFEFEPSSERLRQLIELIDTERQCCPFFTFVLQVPAGEKALVLEITGSAEAKLLIWAELLADESGSPGVL